MGFQALYSNQSGIDNTASGTWALFSNSTGSSNTASGYKSLYSNTDGNLNVALGDLAMFDNVTGRSNATLGTSSLSSNTSGSGQLGVLASSERYKTQVASMGSSTAKLTQLRPVTFRLKNDPRGGMQYGLIAEEVARVYPELVLRDENGRIQGVRYEELAPMLLNEVRKQSKVIDELTARLSGLEQQQAHGSGVIDSH